MGGAGWSAVKSQPPHYADVNLPSQEPSSQLAGESSGATAASDRFAAGCLALDLEVGLKDKRIHAFAAVYDDGSSFLHRSGGLASALAKLDAFAADATYLLGHNIIAFDLLHLQAAKPDLRLLKLPPIDTLWLNPLAFPRNPYHHLVKHYHDGQLRRERVNDPKLDAVQSLRVLADQRKALREADPDLLVAWHWLTTAESASLNSDALTRMERTTPASLAGVPSGPTGPASKFQTEHPTQPDSTKMHVPATRATTWSPSNDHPPPDLASTRISSAGFDAFFTTLRQAPRPSAAEAREAIRQRLAQTTCRTQSREVLDQPTQQGWALAYALAWLSVAGGNSVMPPWVRHQWPEAGRLVRRLRDLACTDPACHWCRERQDAGKELKRWFGFDNFRPEPKDSDGKPMQQTIVEAGMAGTPVLGILPTGTGKSLCYQVPALSRYDKIGALTVVISPLVALMADQVAGLERHGIGCAVTVNGLLSMPERKDALDRVRLGDAGILIIAPEQLRSVSVRRTLEQREIGAWVLDEAHCLSRWGHDFRPDYRYVTRFIREKTPDAPVLCLTATAKPEVREDILRHFRERSGMDLKVFDGGASRTNLEFVVVQTTPGEKFAHIHQILEADLPPEVSGGAIVYCATRRRSEDIAGFLSSKDIAAQRFHAGLSPEIKKTVQQQFIEGDLRVIVATNAFGMGIDKPDVRLVIHADIPGSLENYLQEAGRAGRDRASARCVLLYTADDVERQFGLSARSRLSPREIQGILKALRNLDRKKRTAGEVIATSGEILGEDEDAAFERDSATDDNRVRTAISWLEEAQLLTREENRVQVFPSSLRVGSVAEARGKLTGRKLPRDYCASLLAIAKALIEADPDEGISTDELVGVSGLSPEAVRKAMFDLEALGIANNDTALTAFVHVGVPRASRKRLEEATALEGALIEALQEAAPDLRIDEASTLHLRLVTQRLKDAGHAQAMPEFVWRLLRSIHGDGRDEGGGKGSLGLRRLDPETVRVTLQRDWKALAETALRRRNAAQRLLEHLLSCLPPGIRGTDLLAETTLGKLMQALKSDLELKAKVTDPEKLSKLLDRALLWLHEQEVVRLNKGLAVFRPAMSIQLGEDRRRFVKADFTPLALHYQDQVLQIHVMAEFAQRGLRTMAEALTLAMDYFSLSQDDFLRRWLPDKGEDLARQTTPESWRGIVESLRNPVQQRIVADDQEQANLLVLAGPGSGKTRVLVHRIAYLLRMRRENPRGILALAYNRHAAVEIRRRLAELVGDDARGVLVYTCHGLAMRLVGASFSDRKEPLDDDAFREVMRQAVALLRGDGLPPEEVDEQRARLLAGFRWILVDEYQDIGPDQYELTSALAGRTLANEDDKLSLFAVGDDDQNIYAFAGASVQFIRRFEEDYRAKPTFLTDNYRSTAHIVAAANAAIEPAAERMKSDHPIRVDRGRRKVPPGGDWAALDPVAQGRVQVLPLPRNPIAQAQAAMAELQRLKGLAADWDWSACAVIARQWEYLAPVRAWCEMHGVPVQMGDEEIPKFWRLRETQALLDWLHGRDANIVDGAALRQWLDQQSPNPWTELLHEAADELSLETGGTEMPTAHLIEWLAEWGREVRRRQRGLLLLTAHRAKGLEFDHVVVLDGGWCANRNRGEDADAPRRLLYVAMTRARKTLALMRFEDAPKAGQRSFTPSRARQRTSRNADERIPDRVEAPPPPLYLTESHLLPVALQSNASVLRRPPPSLPPAVPQLESRYQRLDMGDVDLGFAGRRAAGHPLHKAIAALSPGDPLTLRKTGGNGNRWELFDQAGQCVGCLANSFKPPVEMHCRSATVLAIVTWSREISEPQFQPGVKCDAWEVVVPELTFVPDGA